ncbi:Alpha/Beta hydrolase protein [Mycena vulgaris]|nr:Alpha/Beta hydrolase protein [Mycena vulgaris]KAJ6545819.1 Alpha/Beta hydrolase protein [Mycena vulgaris]
MSSTPRKYADLPWYGVLGLVLGVIPLPAVLIWTALIGRHAKNNKGRPLKRVIGERAFRYGITHFSLPQLQFAFGTTKAAYAKWTKQVKLAPVVDELGDGARLLWIGPKRTDRVMLYLHGGCFLLPLTDFSLDLWRYVQLELEKKDIQIGVAVLEYTLAPAAMFPTPLHQACLALKSLFAGKLLPENLHIIGDSAGANLALQLISQMLHPRDNVPEVRPPSPIGGLCLISPWASLTIDSKSFAEFDGIDTMTPYALGQAGMEILSGFPEADATFAEPAKASEMWFKGVNGLVRRILITAGSNECMRDDILQVGDRLKSHHPTVEVVVQKGGLHDDMFFDFLAKEKNLGTLTPLVVKWLAAGYA